MASRGKKFEERFKKDWIDSVKESFIYRLNDQMSGYRGSSNICDFICYKYPNIFIIDCKSIQGNTLPFSDLRQYEKMLEYKDVKGVYVGFIVWFVDHDKVLWIPVQTMEKIKNEDKKSYNIKMLSNKDEYEVFDIPSKKLRTFMSTDYGEFVGYMEFAQWQE